MRKENKNWTLLNKRVLRFGDLSRYQRKVCDIPVKYTEVYLKCEQCDQELTVCKQKLESGEYGWDLKNWQVYLRKSQVLKDEDGYFLQSRAEFYCSGCQG